MNLMRMNVIGPLILKMKMRKKLENLMNTLVAVMPQRLKQIRSQMILT